MLHHRPGRPEAAGGAREVRRQWAGLSQLHPLPQPGQLPQLGQRQRRGPRPRDQWSDQHACADQLRQWVHEQEQGRVWGQSEQ